MSNDQNPPSFFKSFLSANQKTLGIIGLLFFVFGMTGIVQMFMEDGDSMLGRASFWGGENVSNRFRDIGLYGIIAVGVAFVIVTGGIDLSIGSVIGFTGVLFAMLVTDGVPEFIDSSPNREPLTPGMAFTVIISLSLLIGLIHGLLITKLRLQPFLVTLCGLFIYRGVARRVANDQTYGFGNQYTDLRDSLVKGEFLGFIPMSFVVLVLIAVVAAILLNKTTFGRYILALGRNEQAAHFSGVPTDRMKIYSYMICSLLAGFGGVMFVLDTNGATPSKFGNFYELYAISGAVLGGCSLRGGEGAIAGVVCGAALVQIASQAAFFLGVHDQLKYTVIGSLILVGVIVDEILKRYAARRRALSMAK
jgi:ribose transport system permease protein